MDGHWLGDRRLGGEDLRKARERTHGRKQRNAADAEVEERRNKRSRPVLDNGDAVGQLIQLALQATNGRGERGECIGANLGKQGLGDWERRSGSEGDSGCGGGDGGGRGGGGSESELESWHSRYRMLLRTRARRIERETGERERSGGEAATPYSASPTKGEQERLNSVSN
jgi:hypothetical protein